MVGKLVIPIMMGGLAETVTTPSGTITYEYDQFNRLEKVIGRDPTDYLYIPTYGLELNSNYIL